MFREWTTSPKTSGEEDLTIIRRPLISIAALALMALLCIAGPATAAAPSTASCLKKYDQCVKRCLDRYPGNSDQQIGCANRTCRKQYDNCMSNVGSGGSKAETPRDPLNPKGTGGHTSPTGGTKAEPKAPPKVNDTRPPMGGGVFQPKSSDAGSSGPILHSTGSGQPAPQSGGTSGPILKSNGSGGPSFRSNGRH